MTVKRGRKPLRGRPPSEATRDVRLELLRAARDLFLDRSYREVSLRELAAAVGVSPAMVRYYFGDKQGLYVAMLRDVMGPLVGRIERMLAAPAQQRPDLAGFLREYMKTAAANPWLPRLILRDVLAPDGGFRDRFVEEFAGKLAPKVAQLAGRGGPGAPLDPRFTVISMLSLGLWPFLAMPVLERALDFHPDDAGIERLIDHTVRFFTAATAAGAPT